MIKALNPRVVTSTFPQSSSANKIEGGIHENTKTTTTSSFPQSKKKRLQARNQAVMYDGISVAYFVLLRSNDNQSSLQKEMGSLTWLSGHKEQYCSKVSGQFQLNP